MLGRVKKLVVRVTSHQFGNGVHPLQSAREWQQKKNKAKLLIELFHMASKFSGERRHMLLALIFFKKKLMGSEILLKNNLSALKDNHILVLS